MESYQISSSTFKDISAGIIHFAARNQDLSEEYLRWLASSILPDRCYSRISKFRLEEEEKTAKSEFAEKIIQKSAINTAGDFNLRTKEITMNLEAIELYFNKKKKFFSSLCNSQYEFNILKSLVVHDTIFHEFDHAVRLQKYQSKVNQDLEDDINAILFEIRYKLILSLQNVSFKLEKLEKAREEKILEKEVLKKEKLSIILDLMHYIHPCAIYFLYYYCIPFERSADINAINNTISLTKIMGLPKFEDYFRWELKKRELSSYYKSKEPSILFLKKSGVSSDIIKDIIERGRLLDFEQRKKLGLKLTREELKTLEKEEHEYKRKLSI